MTMGAGIDEMPAGGLPCSSRAQVRRGRGTGPIRAGYVQPRRRRVVVNGVRDGKGGADGGSDGGDGHGIGWRGAARRSMDMRDGVGLPRVAAGVLTILFLTLHLISPLPEPWRTIMGVAAFAVALLTVVEFCLGMLNRKRHEDRLDVMDRHNRAMMGELLKGQEETHRLLRLLIDKSA